MRGGARRRQDSDGAAGSWRLSFHPAYRGKHHHPLWCAGGRERAHPGIFHYLRLHGSGRSSRQSGSGAWLPLWWWSCDVMAIGSSSSRPTRPATTPGTAGTTRPKMFPVPLRVEGLWGGEVGKARPPQATSPPTYLSLAFLTCPSTFQCVCVWRDRWMDDGWVGRDGIEAASSISFRRFFAFMRGPVERDGMGWDGLGWAGLGRESWAIRPRGSRY